MTITKIENNIYTGLEPTSENLEELKNHQIKLLIKLFPDNNKEDEKNFIKKEDLSIEDYDMNILKIEIPEKVLDTYILAYTPLVDIVKVIYIESLKVPVYIYSVDNGLDVILTSLLYAFINNKNIQEVIEEIKRLGLIEKSFGCKNLYNMSVITEGVKSIITKYLVPYDFYRAPSPFSNFSKHKVFSSRFNKTFPYSEALFMAFESPKDEDYINKLSLVKTPNVAKSLGRKVKLRDDWEEVKFDFMVETLREKVKSNPDLKISLEETKLQPIYEHTKNDKIWGDNIDRTGRNLLGKAWNKIRLEYTAGLI